MAPSQPTTDQHICPRCTQPATRLCGTCKNIRYCSAECQQADWPSHESLCKSFKEFTEPRPSPGMKRVVVILPGEPKPRFMWAPLSDDHCGSMYVYPARFLDYSPKPLCWKNVETSKNVWTGRQLGYVVQVWYDDNFAMNFYNGDPDPALFAATQGQEVAGWCGPMVVCRVTLPKDDWDDDEDEGDDEEKLYGTTKVLDMDMLAYSHAISLLIGSANDTRYHAFRKGKKLQYVELACGSEVESPEPHSVILLPRTHPKLKEIPSVSAVPRVLFSPSEPLQTYH